MAKNKQHYKSTTHRGLVMIDCTSRMLKSLPNFLSITGVVSARQKEGKGKHKCEHDRAMALPPTTVSQSWSPRRQQSLWLHCMCGHSVMWLGGMCRLGFWAVLNLSNHSYVISSFRFVYDSSRDLFIYFYAVLGQQDARKERILK